VPQAIFDSQLLKGNKTEYVPGPTAISFLRVIPPLSKYHIYSRIVTWTPDNRLLSDCVHGSRNEPIPSVVPKDEAVCAVMYAPYCWKLKPGENIPITEMLQDEGYEVCQEMVELNKQNWQLAKVFHEVWENKAVFQHVRIASRL
jgi:hypothetical protein